MSEAQKNHFGFGTAAIGRPLYINLKQQREAVTPPFSLSLFKEKGIQVLDAAYNQGIRYFDTAPGYGMAENLLLDWLKSKNDQSIVVSTKWGYTYMANFDPKATQHELKEHSLKKLNEQWNFSKKLLPNLKIYQIHSATFDTGVLINEPVLERLHQIKTENGLIIGLTTTGLHQTDVIKKALNIEFSGERLFQSFQCTFNVLDQGVALLKEALKTLKGPFIIKEALANGRLIPNTKYSNYTGVYEFMKGLAKKYQVDVDAIALRYCVDIFNNAIVLSGANNMDQLRSNLKANTFVLTPLELEQLSTFGVTSEDYWKERKELTWN